jgi:hypothetical protein
MAKSNGALSEAFLEEVMSSAVYSRFVSPQVHVVKGDAVSATLMFANDDSAISGSGSGSSFEVDIVKVQNDKPTVVAKETDDVSKMDIEEAGKSKENELSINNVESKETNSVRKGEEQMGGASDGKETSKQGVSEVEKRTDFISGGGKAPPTTTSSMATPTSISPMPTTPTSTMSLTSTNSSVAAFPVHMPAPEAKSPPTSGHKSPPTSPVIAVFQNMTYVPYISNNHLYLYPVSPHSLVGHTPSQQGSSHMQFMTTPPGLNAQQFHQQELPLNNQKAGNKFKTPRRRRKRAKSPPIPQQPHPSLSTPASQVSPPSLPSPVTHQRNSEDAVATSLCLRRKGEGLPVNPFTLTYTVTSSAGHSWSTNSLEGEGTLIMCI